MEHDGLDELPYFCDDMEYSNEETTNVEHDHGIDELCWMLYLGGSDSDMPNFCEPKQPVEEEEEGTTDSVVYDGIDRISDLPDHVLCKILSFLHIKNAMAAKIISTRWGSLFPFFFFWISPIVIDLIDGDNSYVHVQGKYTRRGPGIRSFEIFTDRLLRETLINVPCLDVLKLKSSHNVRGSMKKLSWIRTALQLNVRELSIHLYMPDELEKLFDMLNGYKGLERLEIFAKGSDLKLPDNFIIPNLRTLVISPDFFLRSWAGDGCSFPNLRELRLSKVDLWSDQLELINSCLALEVLSFEHCYLNSDNDHSSFCLLIQCPLLKNFTIEDCNRIWECALTIDAPKLQVLCFKGLAAESYNFPNPFNSLLSAHIDIEFSYAANGVEELVAACSGAVNLYLSSCFIDALHLTFAQLPVFMNMKQLALGYIQFAGWEMLARLLCNSPNLEKLTFKQGFCLHDGGYVSFESLMTSSPSCLELHVMEIEFLVFDEKEDEIKLVEYFMKHGKVIETLKLSCLPFKFDSTRARMAVLPRQSKLIFQPR